MRCTHCGGTTPDQARFCPLCGAQADVQTGGGASGGGIGYSPRIHDPAFSQYVKSSNRWAAAVSAILALAAVIGFYIYGEVSGKMENPAALFLGIAIGCLFLLPSLTAILRRKKSKTWDGVVVDKTIKEKKRRQYIGNEDYYIEKYTEYAVIVRDGRGKTHRLTSENDDARYNYFQIGEHVRHHAGLNSYEKYDKSRDPILFCNACGTLCQADDEHCRRCRCPLLK